MNPDIITQKLINFIDNLCLAGYHIGINQFTASQDLILYLAAQGQLPTQLSCLRTLLAPILCQSPKEQAEFQYRFENWLNQLEMLTPTPVQTTSEAAFIPRNQPHLERALNQIKLARSFWQGATILFIMILLASIVNFFANNQIDLPLKGGIQFPENPQKLSVPANESTTTLSPLKNRVLERQLGFILLSPVLFFLLWQFWWQYWARLFLTRQSTTLPPHLLIRRMASVARSGD